MNRTLLYRCWLFAAALIVTAFTCAAQPVAPKSVQGRLDQLDRWVAPIVDSAGPWNRHREAQTLFAKIGGLNPTIAEASSASVFTPVLGGEKRPFMFVPILANDTVFQKSQYASGTWFARYIPQDGVLLLRGDAKLSAWMRGLLFLTEGWRAVCCQYPLEGEDDFQALDQAVMGKCHTLLNISGGKPYFTLLTELRGEFIKQKLQYKGALTAKQDARLDGIFGKPASPEERQLRSTLVRQHAHTWALQSMYSQEKAAAKSVANYPIRTVAKR